MLESVLRNNVFDRLIESKLQETASVYVLRAIPTYALPSNADNEHHNHPDDSATLGNPVREKMALFQLRLTGAA